jgi:hypothetical protein
MSTEGTPMTERRLVARGGPQTTALAHKHNLHEYLWPELLGPHPTRWAAVAELVDRAASIGHKRCDAFDGKRTVSAGPFFGEHAERHRQVIRLALADLLEAGIPDFLSDRR